MIELALHELGETLVYNGFRLLDSLSASKPIPIPSSQPAIISCPTIMHDSLPISMPSTTTKIVNINPLAPSNMDETEDEEFLDTMLHTTENTPNTIANSNFALSQLAQYRQEDAFVGIGSTILPQYPPAVYPFISFQKHPSFLCAFLFTNRIINFLQDETSRKRKRAIQKTTNRRNRLVNPSLFSSCNLTFAFFDSRVDDTAHQDSESEYYLDFLQSLHQPGNEITQQLRYIHIRRVLNSSVAYLNF
jgi:hypothetical protein